MSLITLLLVEDDEDDFIITRDLLEDIQQETHSEEAFKLDWARNLEEARLLLARNAHDVCLMDYSLGAIDGISLLGEARALGFSNPIIMLTGQDDATLDAHALSAGAEDYLVKNHLSAARLARAIRYAVARKQMAHERMERLRAESENHAKSEFLAHLSHELRTPLTSILGYTDLLARQIQHREQTQHLNVIRRNGRHLLSLLNDILDLTKIEAGKLDIDIQEVPLQGLLADLFHLLQVKALEKDIELVFTTKGQLPQSIETDPTRLRQIMVNLLGNAIKFTDVGQVELSLHGHIDDRGSFHLHCDVIDSGIGIDPAQIKRLFQPFVQLRQSHATGERGTGLGLAISQRLAQRLKGSIHATSQPGVGSTFTLEIDCGPSTLLDLQPLMMKLGHSEHLLPAKGKIDASILVVDDLADVRNLMGFMIETAGGHVLHADSGQAALDQWQSAQADGTPIELVLMDMQMPEMDGVEATRRLRGAGFDRPIIALTAATMKDEQERSYAAGCNDHLSKPIDERRLVERISHHLARYAEAEPAPAPAQSRILLVEDDPEARRVTELLISSLGYAVDAAATANEALNLARHTHPTTVITDLNLPDMNGAALAEQLKLVAPQARVIALTGSEIDTRTAQIFDSYYLKPVTLQQLQMLLSSTATK